MYIVQYSQGKNSVGNSQSELLVHYYELKFLCSSSIQYDQHVVLTAGYCACLKEEYNYIFDFPV